MAAETIGKENTEVRGAKPSDAARIAALCGQLGYPTTTRRMSARLRQALKDRSAACFVAVRREQGVIGWVHVTVRPLLEVERQAEVSGLVVDERARGQGAGRLLMEAAERWARRKRCAEMSLRSNVIREKAHAFYVRRGYKHYKTQKTFRKRL